MKFIRIFASKALPMLFWILIMLAFDSPLVTVSTLLAALIHECGHVAVSGIIQKGRFSLPHAVLTGLRLSPTRLLSYREELLLALGGPLINILVFILLLPSFRYGSDYLSLFALLNLLTALTNLIPISGYDGYRIIRSAVCPRLGDEKCEKIMSILSILFSEAAVFFSLFIIMKIGEGYWIFTVFFAVLLKEVLKSQERTNLENK